MGRMTYRPASSDALVLFGVTGDLAHKMIFPALYAMAKRGTLTVPVIGVASTPWSVAQLRKRVTDSIKESGTVVQRHTLGRLLSLLRYVSGDYNDAETFVALKRELRQARRPTPGPDREAASRSVIFYVGLSVLHSAVGVPGWTVQRPQPQRFTSRRVDDVVFRAGGDHNRGTARTPARQG